jgi:hypothetical protein
MALSITSSANYADNASTWTITWTGFSDPLNKVEIDLNFGVSSPLVYQQYHLGTTGSIQSGTYSISVDNTKRTNVYDALEGFSLTNAIGLTVRERNYLTNAIVQTATRTGTPVINNRLTSFSVTSPTTLAPINLDLANPANVTASWSRPLSHPAFFGRIKLDVGNSSGGTSTTWTQIYSRSPYATSYNEDMVSIGYNDEIIAAMSSGSPKDIRVRLETLFKTGTSSYTTLSGTSGTATVSNGVTYTFVTLSDIALSNFTIDGDLVTNDLPFTLTSYEAGATHTIKLYVNATLIKTVTDVEVSGSIDIDSTDLTAMLTATDQVNSATAYLTCETFIDTVSYGTKNSNNVTATVGAGYVPLFTAQSHEENTATPDVASLIGKYVKSISTILFTLSGNVTGTGTRIKQIKATIGTQVITTDYTYASNTTTLTDAELITSALAIYGTNQVAVLTITDYRNRSTTYTWSDIEILNYTYPTIHSVNAERADSDGTQNALGVFMNIVLDASVQSLVNSVEKNELYYRVGYKLLGAGSYTYYTAVDTNALTFDDTDTYGTAITQEFDVEEVYEIVIEVYDVLTSASRTVATDMLPKGQVDFLIGDKFISVGKIWEEGSADIASYTDGISVVLDGKLKSRLATGTSPMTIASTTMVDNLNVQYLNGADYVPPTDLHRQLLELHRLEQELIQYDLVHIQGLAN